MHVHDLIDPLALTEAIEAGHIRQQTDAAGMRILNYTEAAVWAKAWTPATLTCRGLILTPSGTVAARPWPKFFNHGQPEAGTLDLTSPVEVTDKADGSLGILHQNMDGVPRVATRGSFASEQAAHATALYRDRYWSTWYPASGVTYLFEIVYPGNRIVLDYGATDDLILLGAVDTETGETHGPDSAVCAGWPGPRTATFEHATLADALAAPPRPNAEGLVVRYLDGSHRMVKIKQEDYLRLHALITHISTTTVWESLTAGQSLVEAREGIPDEFLTWVDQTTAALATAHQNLITAAHTEFARMPQDADRKTFALAAQTSPLRSALFSILDGRDITGWAWKQIRPEWAPARMISEDVA